jgi:spore maturation protein CgeB
VEIASSYEIVILGLTISSSWGNGHATTYRGLMKELTRRGHRVLFLERDMPWYAEHRDIINTEYGEIRLYQSIQELKLKYTKEIETADLVIVGSYVPEGKTVGEWVINTTKGIAAFYDIDTPVTLSRIKREACDYISAEQISKYDLYLSFAGGSVLSILENVYGAPLAKPLYCSVDPDLYKTVVTNKNYDLGYMGTYSKDRQDLVEKLLMTPASNWKDGKFIVAGPQYPQTIVWPENVVRKDHVAPSAHSEFYSSQRYTLNLTREDMVKTGYAPSVRLFEAAACGTPIISDYWEGIDTLFDPGKEVLIAGSSEDVIRYLKEVPEDERNKIGLSAKNRVLTSHTAAHRAIELETYYKEALNYRKCNYSMPQKEI